ncbi:MAG TPA: hypothetical protein VD993_10145 [Chitinophagaceae bacterium]|nr:hypothetical protein [Chitinophagaceae bacterium]
MKRIIIATLALFITANQLNAQAMGQEYRTALGVKFYPGAITIKHFVRDDRAVEGLVYFWKHGFRFTGLYEIHGDINGAPGLKWYVGPGAHIGFWNDEWSRKHPDRNDGVAIGVDGVLGLDYKINKAPINLSIDWQPSFNFIGYSYFSSWGGVSIRYTIK